MPVRRWSRVLLVLAFLVFLAGWGQEEDSPQGPLFTFAWISDLHLDAARTGKIAKGLERVDGLDPDFVLVTGDNSALPAPDQPDRPEPVSLRRQRFFRSFLVEHLRAPAVVLPGDNWPQDFEKVFGAFQFSFDYGGVHFLLLAPDRACKGLEGLSAFDPGTLDWIRADLEASAAKPVLVAIHEPIRPPSFLDAPRLRALFHGRPNVIAVLQGHLHLDLELDADGRTYLVCPSFGTSPAPGLKLVRVFPCRVGVTTIAFDPAEGWRKTGRRERRIDIPPAVRGGLKRPSGGFSMERFSCVPPHALAEDAGLAGRRGELVENMRGFLREEFLRARPGGREGDRQERSP